MPAPKGNKFAKGNTGGRPTEMTQEIAESILAKMAEGLSLAAAAAECDIHRQRVYEWESKNEEFADSIKLGRSKRQAFLERRLLSASEGPVVTSSIFALKNAAGDDWRDKTDSNVHHTGDITIEIGGDVD